MLRLIRIEMVNLFDNINISWLGILNMYADQTTCSLLWRFINNNNYGYNNEVSSNEEDILIHDGYDFKCKQIHADRWFKCIFLLLSQTWRFLDFLLENSDLIQLFQMRLHLFNHKFQGEIDFGAGLV